MTEEEKKTIPEASAETMALYKALSELKEGDQMTYEQLSAIVGGDDIQKKKRYWLVSAVAKCLNDGIIIGCIREIGVKRLENNEIDSVADATHKYIRNRTRKTKKALSAVEYLRLTEEEKRAHCARLAFIGAMTLFAKPSAIKKLEANAEGFSTAPPKNNVSRTLELFKPK